MDRKGAINLTVMRGADQVLVNLAAGGHLANDAALSAGRDARAPAGGQALCASARKNSKKELARFAGFFLIRNSQNLALTTPALPNF